MQVIYKYLLEYAEPTYITVPVGSMVRHFGVQGSELYVWIEIDKSISETMTLEFHIYGTGHEFEHGIYFGTVQVDGFVWHLYQK
jgi:hypothetical protein